nr:hypothetical protein [Deltaproteobacteria bacterium]
MSSQNAKIVFSTAVVGSVLLVQVQVGSTNENWPFEEMPTELYGLP